MAARFATIIRLILWSGPTAIRRPAIRDALVAMTAGVVAIIVATIETHVVRALAYIRCEMGETFWPLPPVTDTDTTASIICEGTMVGIQATLPHSIPSVVERLMTAAVRTRPRNRFFSLQATAGPCCTTNEIARTDCVQLSTVTKAEPADEMAVCGSPIPTTDNEPTETLANQVMVFRHLGVTLLGVTGQAASTALPLYFTRSAVLG